MIARGLTFSVIRKRLVLRRHVVAAVMMLCTFTGALALSVAPALAARGHVFGGEFGTAGSGPGQFEGPTGVAVNEATGEVYVVDKGNNRVERFSQTGVYEAEFNGSGTLAEEGEPAPAGQFSSPGGIAVDNACSLHRPALTEATTPTCGEFDPSDGDVYVVDAGNDVVDKYSAAGSYIGEISKSSGGDPSGLYGVGVDAEGLVWIYHESGGIDSYSNELVNVFLSDQKSQVLFSASPEFAVNSEDFFYVNEEATKLNGFGEVLIKELDNQAATGLAVELSSNDVYVDNEETVGRISQSGALIERFGSGVLGDGKGIGVNSASGTVYVADSSADAVKMFTPEPPAAPTVERTAPANVTSSSATLGAHINPRGEATEYYFDYGPTAAYGTSVPVPRGVLAASFGASGASVQLEGLEARTTYHFHVVAHSALGTAESPDQVFTTQTQGANFALPDNRVWELVSPPDKHGALVENSEAAIQASVEGSAISYVANTPTDAEPQGYSHGVQVFSSRAPGGGWVSQDIAPSHDQATEVVGSGFGSDYRFFSANLSLGVVQPLASSSTPLSPEATESTAYLHRDYLQGKVSEHCAESCYEPLVTAANVPAGRSFGVCHGSAHVCGPEFVGGTPDLNHVVLKSPAALTQTPIEGETEGLYEWSAGSLQLVSILPSEGKGESGAAVAGTLGWKDEVVRHAISDDGSRVIWSSGTSTPTTLYMRDTTTHETIRLDVPQGANNTTASSKPAFMTASSDGSKIFFLDGGKLTEVSTAKSNEPDLYEYDASAPMGSRLTDLTVDSHTGEHANVDNVIGASEDGSYVYFAAGGALTENATAGQCGGAATIKCNLYEYHNGATTLVAALSQDDSTDWTREMAHLTGRVSPDGRWLAFMSDRALTSYDNADAVSGMPDEEVYLYSANAQHVTCVSCNPTGAPPVGVEYAEGKSMALVAPGIHIWGNSTWIAANIPTWTPYRTDHAFYQSRFLSDNGRLFFDTRDALVPQDVNGTEDVYEYSPPGVGSCASSSTTFNDATGGCVSLISSGESAEESAFLDASATGGRDLEGDEGGGDVFFLTAAKLVSQDFDTSFDVYDAHECSTREPCATAAVIPPPCREGESCKLAPSPQPSVFGAPSSETFTGAGNTATAPPAKPSVKGKAKPLTRAQELGKALKVCKTKSRKRRVSCEKHARLAYGPARRAAKARKGGK